MRHEPRANLARAQAFNELNVTPGELVPYWQQGNMDYYTDEVRQLICHRTI